MKKQIISLILALILSLSLCLSAGAVPYIPDDVTYQNLNGQQLAIKVFTLLPEQNPAELIEEDFEYGGYHYTYADIVKEELTFSTESQHQEIVTVETEGKNLEDILAKTGCDVTVEPLKHPAGSKIPLVIRVKGVGEYLFWYYPYASDCRMRNELTGALRFLALALFKLRFSN